MKLNRLLALLLVLALGAAACSNESNTDTAERDDSGEITEGGQTGVTTIQVGDCWNDFGDATGIEAVASIPTVACDEPHDNQVVGMYNDTAAVYPGDELMALSAVEGCTERFASFLTPERAMFPLFPTSEGWDAGDREVICSVYNADLSKLTGDLVG